jgi:hypothetical protein
LDADEVEIEMLNPAIIRDIGSIAWSMRRSYWLAGPANRANPMVFVLGWIGCMVGWMMEHSMASLSRRRRWQAPWPYGFA